MLCKFQVGDKVVCKIAREYPDRGPCPVVVGQVYTVRQIVLRRSSRTRDVIPWLKLVEIKQRFVFRYDWFEKTTGMDWVDEMLRSTPDENRQKLREKDRENSKQKENV